jgi:hypothetical protein
MKIYKYKNRTSRHLIVLLFTVIVFSACDRAWLEPWPPDGARTPPDVWAYYDFTRGFLDAIYSDQAYHPYLNDIQGYGTFACASDEAEHSNAQGAVQNFTNGIWNPTNIPTVRFSGNWGSAVGSTTAFRTPWENSYQAIRRANIFLENVDNSVLIDDVSNPARQFDRTYFKGQAYFWRAFMQFDILKRYGPFPISIKSQSLTENLLLPRNTMEECYNQIIKDLDSAEFKLPYNWDDSNWHRATKTTAQALRSRVCLYYASPLYQGDFATFGLAKNETGEITRWQKAIDAARAAIEENSFYSLMPVTKFNRPFAAVGTYVNQLALVRNTSQFEHIWGTTTTTTYTVGLEYYNMPSGIEGCYGYTNPTQEMVDAFEVVPLSATGQPVAGQPSVAFDWNNPAHSSNPYANRDPRFYASITFNGLVWGNNASKQFPVDTYEGGIHRDPTNPNSTKTGYYFRKWMTEDFYAYKSGQYTAASRSRTEFRFAELILNYAEAMNEVYGPEGIDPAGALRVGASNALQAVNLIRNRVKMPLLPSGLSKDQLREKIKQERRVELCFEGHRFYDLRRWKEGDKLGEPIHGVKITPTGFDANNRPTGFTYAVEKVEDRVWSNKMYWWPIPYAEIVKYEGVLLQNPGW